MKSFLIAALLAGSALTGVAHASPGFDWEGNCRFASVDDSTPGGLLGGPQTWRGEVDVVVVPTDVDTGLPSGAAASVACQLRINGGTPQTVLEASGTGIVVGAGPVTFTAGVTDTVELCTSVTVGAETITDCGFGHGCPLLTCRAGQVVGEAVGVVDWAIQQTAVLDPVVCAQLMAAAPAVDSLPTADVLYIDPGTGDLFAGGRTSPDDVIWDCPPYLNP